MHRRRLLATIGALPLAAIAQPDDFYPQVRPRPLVFPRDHGAHPDYRVEWWYLTAVLESAPGSASPSLSAPLGIQMTFFRVRTPIDPAHPSRFAAHQLLVAHAAIADPARASLLKDERVARAGFGLAHAALHDTDVQLGRWRLWRAADGAYRCEAPARGFDLRFTAAPTQPLLLQGEDGFSRKGPRPEQASHYYTQPQLRVEASIERDGRVLAARGVGWLDHEWSTAVLDDDGEGWDWIGMNLDHGAALTAFEIRRRDGGTVYAYASLREPGTSRARVFAPAQVRFTPLEHWRSPRTQARWPVAQKIAVGARVFETRPLFADQELDSRASTGAVYWEGASTLLEGGRRAGVGYLEMTGYLEPIRL
jgi:predicted secreted hydrolase